MARHLKLKGTGTLFKSVAIMGTGLTVVDNAIKSQDDGFQLQDVRDVALDTGVDLAYAREQQLERRLGLR